MGFISAIFDDFQSSNKIYSGQSGGSDERQILAVVRPIGRFCRAFGVFPFSFTTLGTRIYLEYKKGPWFILSLIILLITSAYMTFQIGSFIYCLQDRPIIRLTAQSIWSISAIPSLLTSIFMLVRGKALVQLFEDWAAIEQDLERLFCPIMTKKYVGRFQSIYFVISIVSISFVGYHAYQRPDEPVYPFFYLSSYSQAAHLAYVFFQMVMVAWIWAGLVILEGTCCLFATVIGQCMSSLEMGLSFTFNRMTQKAHCENSYADAPGTSVKNHEQFMATAVHAILMKDSSNRSPSAATTRANTLPETKENEGPFKEESLKKIQKDEYLLFVVQKMQTVGLLQTRVNNILGPLLLVDVAQLVILVCLMLILPIRYIHRLEGFEVGVTFLGNGVAVLVRLVLFVVVLGKVYSKGLEVNVALARALISAKLSAECQTPVLAHLCVYSSNPITFTAYDYFPVTRGTLLAAFSLISTYAIVFLQINF